MRRGDAPVFSNGGSEAWDLGDGILGLTFKTKANSIDDTVVEGLTQAVDIAERDFRGMVIYNQGDHFCVGANLFAVVMAAQQKAWDQLREMIKRSAGRPQRMKYSTIPVVAAPYGMTLGGGLEVCMGADAVQAAAETYVGLVEVGVGPHPRRRRHHEHAVARARGHPRGHRRRHPSLRLPHVQEHRDGASRDGRRRGAGVRLLPQDRRHLVRQGATAHEAKARAIGLAEAGYHPPPRRSYRLPGESGIATLEMMVDTLRRRRLRERARRADRAQARAWCCAAARRARPTR